MAQLNFILDTRKANTNGMFPIKLSIACNKSNTTISTGVFIPKRSYSKKNDAPIIASHPNAKELNSSLRALYNLYLNAIANLELSGAIYSMRATDIRNYVERRKELRTNISFSDVLEEYIGQCRAEKTKYCYIHAGAQLEEFLNHKKISFEELNYNTIKSFDRYLEIKGLGINARGVTMRSIRAIFNEAIKQELVSPNSYPFRRFKVISSTPEKECCGVDVLRKLRDMPLSGERAQARDFFLASFYLCGINPVDLYNMRISSDNKVSFVRQKVSHREPTPIHISIQPELQEIIDRYKGKEYLLDYAERYSSYLSFKRNMGAELNKLGKELGAHICFKNGRHTWASIADHLGISHDVISKALGHCDKGVTEVHYINFDWTRVDKANRSVLDYVNNDNAII